MQRDDELLDLLGLRRRPWRADDRGRPRLLAALAAEVDDGLAGLLDDADLPIPAAPPPPGADAAGHGRRLGAAGVAAAVLLGGSVALSGAAAAVTGDPLAPYKTVGHVVGPCRRDVGAAVGDALSFGDDDLPEQAAPIAHLNKRLAGARAALAHGDTTEVRALVDELTAVLATADLSDEQRAALQQRLDKLEDSLARATAADGEGKKHRRTRRRPRRRPPGRGAKATRSSGAGRTKAPADKAPADKAPAAGETTRRQAATPAATRRATSADTLTGRPSTGARTGRRRRPPADRRRPRPEAGPTSRAAARTRPAADRRAPEPRGRRRVPPLE